MTALVVGLGAEHRGDDDVGLEAARRLATLLDGVADVRAHPGEPVDLIPAWAGAELVVLIDAARSGLPPGSVRRYELGRDALPSGQLGVSSHAFDLLVAFELAASLDLLPERLVLFAVEGERFGLGDARSRAVDGVLGELIERVRAEVDRTPAAARRADATGGAGVRA